MRLLPLSLVCVQDRRQNTMRFGVSLPTHFLLLQALLSWLSGRACGALILLQTVSGSVPPGNFSYYKLSRAGNIRLVLRTLVGDADVYITSKRLHPTYEDYDLKSTTYGDEVVEISEHMQRPAGIGIYGHPLYQADTSYEFDIWLDTSESEDPWRTEAEREEPLMGKLFTDENQEKESLLWNIFIGILKVVLDVMI